ncbi:MAG: hypothetical protein LQ340_003616 [Diploschistes diacapsis]|nr:MAG: hypothetical protein LQ340_003616 [Diploschistes diacapsis]
MAAATVGMRMAGKVAIVTGAASGFGAAIARRFAQEGAKVCIADLNESGGRELASSMPDSMSFHRLNVTQRKDWISVVEKVHSDYGKVDCLVNNAGTTYSNKPTLEVTEDDFDRCFDVNVRGVFHGFQTVIPYMRRSRRGSSIINMASVGAIRPRPGLVWYNSSKGAVWNATKGLAAEYGPDGIRVNSVCPLLSGTGLFSKFAGVENTEENRGKFLSNVPLGRLTEPSDVANAVLFLASDESAFITGVNMEIDGGRAI